MSSGELADAFQNLGRDRAARRVVWSVQDEGACTRCDAIGDLVDIGSEARVAVQPVADGDTARETHERTVRGEAGVGDEDLVAG